jgi:hypothetical protein
MLSGPQFIDRYSGRHRRSVSYMLGAQNFYIPIFEQALETYGLPLELKYLPVIESALNPKAVSRVGATGLWQFMVTTGKQYGLEVNSMVDERCDPVKSSYAAANYLSDLYKKKIVAKNALSEELSAVKTRLSQFLDTKVQLTCSPKGKGKISIPFANEEELEKIKNVFFIMFLYL